MTATHFTHALIPKAPLSLPFPLISRHMFARCSHRITCCNRRSRSIHNELRRRRYSQRISIIISNKRYSIYSCQVLQTRVFGRVRVSVLSSPRLCSPGLYLCKPLNTFMQFCFCPVSYSFAKCYLIIEIQLTVCERLCYKYNIVLNLLLHLSNKL